MIVFKYKISFACQLFRNFTTLNNRANIVVCQRRDDMTTLLALVTRSNCNLTLTTENGYEGYSSSLIDWKYNTEELTLSSARPDEYCLPAQTCFFYLNVIYECRLWQASFIYLALRWFGVLTGECSSRVKNAGCKLNRLLNWWRPLWAVGSRGIFKFSPLPREYKSNL